ncbi:MAG: NAD-dependent epimerase/dehydratase family protein [Pirellulales bacterium]
MKLVITGASGFLGRHVLDSIVKKNESRSAPHHIIATFHRKNSNLPTYPFVTWKQFDLQKEPRNLFGKLDEPHALLHLAWQGLPNYQSNHHLEQELPLHIDFIQAMVEGGIHGVAIAGTCYEYGLQNGCLAENLPANPVTAYAKAKNKLRCYIEQLSEAKNISFSWLRIFYLYGPDQPSRTLYSQLLNAIRENKKTFDMSGGEQVRDYLPINKASHLMSERFMKLAESGTGDGIVNIASGRGKTVLSIVKKWIRENNSTIKPNLGVFPYPSHEPMEFWADTTKLNKLSDGIDPDLSPHR